MASDVERGNKLLRVKGCVACHSLDGSARVGPSFFASWGSARKLEGGATVTFDEAYLARSVREPDAEIAGGFPRGNMPRFNLSDAEVADVGAALRELKVEPKGPEQHSIAPLAASAASFALLHFVLSAIPVRKALIRKLGAKAFAGVYSLFAFATFGAMVWFYRLAPYVEIWQPARWTRWVPLLSMPIALFFLVVGFSTPSPTAVGQESKASEDPPGIQAITRHPALWGFALWALAHLATNGELHVILVALSILVLSIGGMLHIDARRKHDLGDAWASYSAKTSVVPFGAILGGRTKLRWREIGFVRPLIVVFVYTTILHLHAAVIGASPFP